MSYQKIDQNFTRNSLVYLFLALGRQNNSAMVPYDSVWSCLVLYSHVNYGPIWLFMAPNDQVWFCMPRMVPYGPTWPNIALFGPYGPVLLLPLLAPYGPKWPHMASDSLVWPHMGPYGPVWLSMALYGPVFIHVRLPWRMSDPNFYKF